MSVSDYYFSSGKSIKAFEDMGLGFIGVVKQASRQYPMGHLKSKYFNSRGYFMVWCWWMNECPRIWYLHGFIKR